MVTKEKCIDPRCALSCYLTQVLREAAQLEKLCKTVKFYLTFFLNLRLA
jgi:hypothetical protein